MSNPKMSGQCLGAMLLVLLVACGDGFDPTVPLRSPVPNASVVPPAPPTNLTATLTPVHAVALGFQTATVADSRVEVLRKYPNRDFNIIATLSGNATSYTDNSFSVRRDTATWGVRECVGAECSSITEITLTGIKLPPPTNLMLLVGTPGNVHFSWTDNSTTEKRYDIIRTDVEGASVTTVLPANSTSFTDATALAGVQYYYAVQARVPVGRSSDRAVLPVVPGAGPPAAPTAVTDSVDKFWFAQYAGKGFIRVNSSATGNGAQTNTWIEYGKSADLSDATTTPVRDIGAGTVPVIDRDTLGFPYQHGITIYYRLVASNSEGTTYGDIRSFYYGRPPLPANLTGTLTPDHRMHLTYETVPGLETTLRISRRYPGGSWQVLADGLPGGGTEYLDSVFDVLQDSIFWGVSSCNPLGCSGSEVLVHGTELQRPGNLRIVSSTAGSVTIAWDEASSTEKDFQIWRTDHLGNITRWTVPPDTTTFADNGIAGGVQYTYKVRARADAKRVSRYSNKVLFP